MSVPEKSGGWLSAFGRIFGSKDAENGRQQVSENGDKKSVSADVSAPNPNGHSAEPAPPNLSTSKSSESHGIRYLSPTVLNNMSERSDTNPLPSTNIFGSDPSNTRKRQLTSGSPGGMVNGDNSISQIAKRFRGNQSLLEAPVSKITDRADMTWSGIGSIHNASPSSSNRSLMSRVSGTTSLRTGSVLSSRTRAILSQIEKITTPSKEAQKLPVMRSPATFSEKWAPLRNNTGNDSTLFNSPSAPPLKKTSATTPSRIQLMSSAISDKRKYWKNIAKAQEKVGATERELNDTISSISNGNPSKLHPLFDITATPDVSRTTKEPAEKKKHQSVVKGSDGRATNVFSARALDDDFVDGPAITPVPIKPIDQVIPLAKESIAPPKGFLDDTIFKFAAPTVKRPGMQSQIKVNEIAQNVETTSDSESNDSESDEDDSGSDSEVEVITATSEIKSTEKSDARPSTSTDSETSAEVVTPASSKNVSPSNVILAKGWSCQVCFVENKADSKTCLACETPKGNDGSVPATKTLKSNLDTFAAKNTGSFSFGFGASSASSATSAPTFGLTSALDSAPKPAINLAVPTPMTKPLGESTGAQLLTSTGAQVLTSTTTAPKAEGETTRVAWECPDCMVSNKATDSKCPCCGHQKYKDEGSSGPTSVFGSRAFKPTASVSGVSFGVGKGASSTVPAFGTGSTSLPISTTTAPKTDVTSPSATVLKPAAPTLGVGTGFGTVNPPLFAGAIKPSTTTTTTPVFGTTSTLFGTLFSSGVPTAKLEAPPTSTPAAFGSVKPSEPAKVSSGFVFGNNSSSTPSFGSLGAATAAPAVAPALSASSSTNSLFNIETPSTFVFGGNTGSTSGSGVFQFGSMPAAPSSGVFGTSQPAATSAPAFPSFNANVPNAFAFGGSADTNQFAFSNSGGSSASSTLSAGARKMATAKRRMPARR